MSRPLQTTLLPSVALRTLAPTSRPVFRLANGAQVLRVDPGDADATIARPAAHPDVQYAMRDPVLQRAVVDDPWYEGYVQVGAHQYSRFQADRGWLKS